MTILSYILNATAADVLAKQGARASAAMVLTYLGIFRFQDQIGQTCDKPFAEPRFVCSKYPQSIKTIIVNDVWLENEHVLMQSV